MLTEVCKLFVYVRVVAVWLMNGSLRVIESSRQGHPTKIEVCVADRAQQITLFFSQRRFRKEKLTKAENGPEEPTGNKSAGLVIEVAKASGIALVVDFTALSRRMDLMEVDRYVWKTTPILTPKRNIWNAFKVFVESGSEFPVLQKRHAPGRCRLNV